MNPPPLEAPFDMQGVPNRAWIDWLVLLYREQKFKGSGTTANRPTNMLTIGDWYYDTTVGYPIWVHSIGPVVWHKADGTVA